MRGVIRLSKTTTNIMKDVCKLSLQSELQKLTELDISNIVYQSLSTDQINRLVQKINFLPFEYRNILFFRYYFENTVFDIDKVLKIEDTEGKLLYTQSMLSRLMELENSWIDNGSMKKACKLALEENMIDYDTIEILHQPEYSNSFKRKLKQIKIAQSPYKIFKLISKKVAMFILICILSFSTFLAVHAEERTKFFNWIVETFPEFSIFIPLDSQEDDDLTDLASFKINYIPAGFELVNTHEGRNMLIYNYLAKDNKQFDIKLFASSGGGKSYYDTEGIEIKEFIFKGSNAYMWQTDEMAYLIWSQDGIECHISANLDHDVIIKIAEGISK